MYSRQIMFTCDMSLIIVFLVAAFAPADELRSVAGVSRSVEDAIQVGRFDLAVVSDVRELPPNDRPPLAVKLADSPNPAMRRQALIILQDYPPAVAAETMRRLTNDESLDNRTEALFYLAARANDADARALLLKDASHTDPTVAARAVTALGSLSGPDVGKLLAKLLGEQSTPKSVRVTAIVAAGGAHATECTELLVTLLDDRTLRTADTGETVRMYCIGVSVS